MSITAASLTQNLNTYFGDDTTDRVSSDERYQALTEATSWLLEELGNEHMIDEVDIDHYPSINKYNVTGILPDLLVGADLRRASSLQTQSFSRKSPREIAEDIGREYTEPSWAIERVFDQTYLVINFVTQTSAQPIDTMDSTDGWTADATTDALNIALSKYEKTEGSASVSFDIDVSQSANDYATVYKNGTNPLNLESHEDISGVAIDFYIADVTDISSVTMYWGSDDAVTPATRANYWYATVTTDYNGAAFVDGWNTLLFDWKAATSVGTPDSTTVGYYEVVLNYAVGQADQTLFRIDNMRVVKPEKLTFKYISWNVGQVSAADPTKITAFTATTNVPFFSGSYDQYRYPVAHKAASILFYSVRLGTEAEREEIAASRSLSRYRKNFESSKIRESHSFKPAGINFRRRRNHRR